MSDARAIVDALKQVLRSAGMTYRELGEQLELSEASIKRLFSTGRFTLQRLDQVCDALGIGVADLIEIAAREKEPITELTEEQERQLLAHPKLLLLTYLIVNNWQPNEITATFAIERNEMMQLLYRLNRLRIIEVQPGDRIRKLTARNFSWRKSGPVQRFFHQKVQTEFFSSRFDKPGEHMRFAGGMLSRHSVLALHRRINALAREFDDLCQSDAALPMSQKYGVSTVLAVRPWEFSGFTKLRRDASSRKTFELG
ncbi:MAG: helix-turn-helix transcriptional regulator [Gammaproteobacteria bacterium]|nr:helix-turn-helix transcriptional regulator [Gammaproteobacteria bacterium]